MKRFILITGIAISLCVFSACEKEENNIAEPQEQSNLSPEQKSEMISVLEKAGFDTNNIVVEKDRFVVEGDIVIAFEAIPEIRKSLEKQDETGLKAYQFKSTWGMNKEYAKDVKIYVDPLVKPKWDTAIKEAVKEWNKISVFTVLTFRIVSKKSEADVSIVAGKNLAENTIARAYFPWKGKPGELIRINLKYKPLPASEKKNAMAHELGHVIGLAHTNGKQSAMTTYLISGTVGDKTNEKSVMWPINHKWYGFSKDEIKAVEILFPVSEQVRKQIEENEKKILEKLNIQEKLEQPVNEDLKKRLNEHLSF